VAPIKEANEPNLHRARRCHPGALSAIANRRPSDMAPPLGDFVQCFVKNVHSIIQKSSYLSYRRASSKISSQSIEVKGNGWMTWNMADKIESINCYDDKMLYDGVTID